MRKPTTRLPRALVLALAWTVLFGTADAGSVDRLREEAAIRNLIDKTWSRPEEKVVIDPVIVDDDYAIAGWTQGQRGGRALLKKHNAEWAVVLCSGDGLKVTRLLVEVGVPEDSATRLADALASAEAEVDDERVELFSTFEGVMRMSGEHASPHHGREHQSHDLETGTR